MMWLAGKPDAPNVIQAMSCFGCTLCILSAILFVFVLTHVGPIWQALSRLVGS